MAQKNAVSASAGEGLEKTIEMKPATTPEEAKTNAQSAIFQKREKGKQL
jgi:hypothetical protein